MSRNIEIKTLKEENEKATKEYRNICNKNAVNNRNTANDKESKNDKQTEKTKEGNVKAVLSILNSVTKLTNLSEEIKKTIIGNDINIAKLNEASDENIEHKENNNISKEDKSFLTINL